MNNEGDPRYIPAIYMTEHVLATGPNAITLYNKGYYGTPHRDGVILNGFEALHLAELGRIQIHSENNELLNEEVITEFYTESIPNFMDRYLVYKDLRNRGYVVNVGEGSSFFFRLYARSAKPKQDPAQYYVTPLKEGGNIDLGDLENLMDIANKSRKRLVFGLVDAVGDVSYLQISSPIPKPLKNREFANFSSWNWDDVWEDYQTWEK